MEAHKPHWKMKFEGKTGSQILKSLMCYTNRNKHDDQTIYIYIHIQSNEYEITLNILIKNVKICRGKLYCIFVIKIPVT